MCLALRFANGEIDTCPDCSETDCPACGELEELLSRGKVVKLDPTCPAQLQAAACFFLAGIVRFVEDSVVVNTESVWYRLILDLPDRVVVIDALVDKPVI